MLFNQVVNQNFQGFNIIVNTIRYTQHEFSQITTSGFHEVAHGNNIKVRWAKLHRVPKTFHFVILTSSPNINRFSKFFHCHILSIIIINGYPEAGRIFLFLSEVNNFNTNINCRQLAIK